MNSFFHSGLLSDYRTVGEFIANSRLPSSLDEEPLRKCHYCALSGNTTDSWLMRPDSTHPELFVCPRCGWWIGIKWESVAEEWGAVFTVTYGAVSELLPLSAVDHSPQILEARNYLRQNITDGLRTITPSDLEHIVASIFRDIGFHVVVTNFSNDGGIDMFLDGAGGVAGVQVKKYRNSIKVEQIRSFAGAMILGGIPRGVFITTGSYQSGCYQTVKEYRAKGLSIDLVNGNELFNALEIEKVSTRLIHGNR
jgi:restriction system protein